MAIVKLVDGQPPIRNSRNGMVYFSRNGRQVVRVKVKPVFPRTAEQLIDINGIAMASRAWRNTLTPEQIASWGFPCVWGWPGSPWMQAIWSIIMWIWRQIPPGTWSGFCPPLCCATGVTVNSVGGVLNVTVCSALPASFRGYIALTPPISAGAVPRVEQSRVLAIGVEPGATVDLAAAYVARFGRLPVAGSIGVATRFADLTTGSSTAVCFVVVPVGSSEDLQVSTNGVGITVGPFSPPQVLEAWWAETVGSTTSCSWSIHGLSIANCTVPGPTTIGQHGDFVFTDNGSGDAVENVTLRATSQQTGATADLPYTINSSSM